MQNPWDVRPRKTAGDPAAGALYHNVGAALTQWESLESSLAELFDALVTNALSKMDSNRAAFCAFRAVTVSSARTELVTAAAPRALKDWTDLLETVVSFLGRVADFGSRRNEIAHGMVVSAGEFGFYLVPNNVNPRKWDKNGKAKYQYVAADIQHYLKHFTALRSECEELTSAVFARRSKDRGN